LLGSTLFIFLLAHARPSAKLKKLWHNAKARFFYRHDILFSKAGVKISNSQVYDGPIPINEVRRTHKRIINKAEYLRENIAGAIPIDEVRKTHKRIIAKIEAARSETNEIDLAGRNISIQEPVGQRDLKQRGVGQNVVKQKIVKPEAAVKAKGEAAKNNLPKTGEPFKEPHSDEFLVRVDSGSGGNVVEKKSKKQPQNTGSQDLDIMIFCGGNTITRTTDHISVKPHKTLKNQIKAETPAMVVAKTPVKTALKPPPESASKSPPELPPESSPEALPRAKESPKTKLSGTETQAANLTANTLTVDPKAVKFSAKARLPIAVKLVSLVTTLLVLSLGVITALVSILVSADVKLTAEDNNFSINQRTAEAIQTRLSGVNAAAALLFHDIESLKYNPNYNSNNQDEAENSIANLFFEQNPQIAAVSLDGKYFINETFFKDNGGDGNIPRAWAASAADDKALLRNATPFFGLPVIVMRVTPSPYPAEVFFTSETLNTLLDSGKNISYLLNENGDVLLHTDIDILRGGVNFRRNPFIKNILDNSNSSIQNVYTDENGDEYLAAFRRLNTGSAVFITIISSNVVLDGITETTIRNIVLSIIVLAVSIIFIILFSRTISKPLRALTNAVDKIENGNYDLQLKAGGNDELGVLTRNFTRMGNSLENFEKFTNKAIVKLAKEGKLSRSGENKKATICFALIRDFSETSDGLDAGAVVDFVNDYLRLMVPCITATGGCVDKFLTQGGVIIMALWGTPETAGSPEKDALNCIKTALSMRAALRCLNQNRMRKLGSHIPLIKLGCGINTGDVIAGQIGSDERMEYTVIGDAVNLAARIEGPNDLFDTDILISEETYKYVGDYLITKEMRSIEVKGKEKPIRIFAVINIISDVNSMLEDLKKIPGTDIDICKQCFGPGGPRTLEDVRKRQLVTNQTP
jgi:adenylate cyclase